MPTPRFGEIAFGNALRNVPQAPDAGSAIRQFTQDQQERERSEREFGLRLDQQRQSLITQAANLVSQGLPADAALGILDPNNVTHESQKKGLKAIEKLRTEQSALGQQEDAMTAFNTELQSRIEGIKGAGGTEERKALMNDLGTFIKTQAALHPELEQNPEFLRVAVGAKEMAERAGLISGARQADTGAAAATERAQERADARLPFQLGKTEFERTVNQLDSGKDFAGKPLSREKRASLEAKKQAMLASEQQQEMSFTAADGSTFTMGPKSANSAQFGKVMDRINFNNLLKSDVEEAIKIIEQDPSRGGAVGSLKSLATTSLGILGESAETLSGTELGFIMEDFGRNLENDISNARAKPELLTEWLDAQGQAQIDVLDFYITYNAARQVKPNGRINTDDRKNASKAFGLRGFTSADRVISRLKSLLRKTDVRLRSDEKAVARFGVSVTPPADPEKMSPEGRALRNRILQEIGP